MRLLIVDDNKYVVEGLKRQLNWSVFGIDEIIGCYRVQQAQEILMEKEIDFLISDIEMPGQNGFALLEWIQEKGMEPETILLTSYADFDYAKQAIRYRCFEYLLKPVETKNLEEVVFRMVRKRIERQKEKSLVEYGNDWLSHQNIVKEMFWRDLLEEEGLEEPKALRKRIAHDRLPYGPGDKFSVILICFEPERSGWSKELLTFSCENVVREIMEKKELSMEGFLTGGYLQFAAVIRARTQEEQVRLSLEEFIGIFSRFYRAGIHCYIGTACIIEELPVHLRRLEEIHLAQLNRKNGIVLENNYAESPADSYQAPEIEEWKELLTSGRRKLFEMRVQDYFAKMKGESAVNYNQLQAVLADWNLLAYSVLRENHITTYQFITHFRDQELLEMSVRSVSCMESLILTESEKITDQIRYLQKTDLIIQDICRYIDEHLDEVTRSRISEVFYLSPNYLSKLFRREMGVSLSEYVQDRRMSLAKRLLLKNELSISQIAAETGYPSFAHFSKQFKKFVGMTPGEYRKGHQR